MTVTEQSEIARYVERVRAALADLPPAVRDELLEELPEHLAEVAAEGDGSLIDRLGLPEAYAEELRAAAGVPTPAGGRDLDARLAAVVAGLRARARALDVKAGPLIGYAKATDFLRLLRPAWWVARGYLVALFLVMLSGDSGGLLPRLGDDTLAALLLLAACVLASIWLGRRSAGFVRWPRYVLNAGTVLLVVFGLVALAEVDQRARSQGYYTPSYNDSPYSQVQDVYVYDSEGRLVEGARLFDQNGQPIRLGYPWCPEAVSTGDQPGPYPYCPAGAPFRFPGTRPGTATPAPSATATLPPAAPSGAPGPSGTSAPGATPAPSATR